MSFTDVNPIELDVLPQWSSEDIELEAKAVHIEPPLNQYEILAISGLLNELTPCDDDDKTLRYEIIMQGARNANATDPRLLSLYSLWRSLK